LKKVEKLMDSSSAINTASSIQTDYMKLLVAQLQNQNPLEPMSNNEMASQLAMFSQLEQLESMNTNFAKVLETAERTYAHSLIGRDIEFIGETEIGTRDIMSGVVEQVYNNVDGEIFLIVGNYVIGLEDVTSVKN
jgi:flagellar basal-body rod modification protein FlgD